MDDIEIETGNVLYLDVEALINSGDWMLEDLYDMFTSVRLRPEWRVENESSDAYIGWKHKLLLEYPYLKVQVVSSGGEGFVVKLVEEALYTRAGHTFDYIYACELLREIPQPDMDSLKTSYTV